MTVGSQNIRVEVAGENALIVYFGEHSSPGVSAQIHRLAALLEDSLGNLLIDLVPSYASLLVIYDVYKTDHLEVGAHIRSAVTRADSAITSEGKLVVLPVYYAEESGPDLARMSDDSGLSLEEIVDLHQGMEYRVYAIGFAPGFAYLGHVDERIAAPRLATPRLKVPRGAVAIADRQTAVYPAVSPGGWNLIGLCPTRMFDLDAKPPMPVEVGDRISFEAISRSRFLDLGGQL
ncbi:MAG: KipI family sensor histidine kinase inhibitor [Halieaceae bacterium]